MKGNDHPLLSQDVPHEFGEAFRALRTSLVFSSGSEGTRVIAMTSAQPLEGKTTTACNMAIALAYGGSRVLIIDADMRRPSVSRTLGIENTIGLSHLLTGQATARQTIRRDQRPESLGDDRGHHAAEPLGASRVGPHEDAHQQRAERVRSTGSSSTRLPCWPSPTR